MSKHIVLRDEGVPERLVVLRLGVNTLTDEALAFTCATSHAELGLRRRPKVLEAYGPDLLRSGFPLLPTSERLHWSVVLSEPTPEHFARVRPHFHGPVDNPVWEGR